MNSWLLIHDLHGRWVEQIARNLTDPLKGFLKDARYLIHDRDPVFTASAALLAARGPWSSVDFVQLAGLRPLRLTQHFKEILKVAGVKTVKLPPRSPNLNAYTERFLLSVRRECLHRMIPLGERHLELMLTEYLAHYPGERNPQGPGNRLIEEPPANCNGTGPVRWRERLGSILHFYYREAA
ncbi:integrase core domain-containing protein [Myxococcota bacterium]